MIIKINKVAKILKKKKLFLLLIKYKGIYQYGFQELKYLILKAVKEIKY